MTRQHLQQDDAARTILFLTSTSSGPANDNATRLPEAFAHRGWTVTTADHSDIRWHNKDVYANEIRLRDNRLIWTLGFGPRRSFADRSQLLSLVPQNHFVVPINAWHTLHGKTAWLKWAPATYISADHTMLRGVIHDNPGKWVLKPIGGSFGENVSLLSDVESFDAAVAGAEQNYWMLQSYIEEIEQGEIRTIVCAGSIIGSYRRIPQEGFRANLAQNARTEKVDLDSTCTTLVQQVSASLSQQGVLYAAIDTAGPYLMEANIANPGGLSTLSDLYNIDAADLVVDAIEKKLNHKPSGSVD